MSVAGPTKTCPRCNTVLPMQATFCGTCGWQFAASAPSAPPAGNYAPTQYAGSGAPGGYPPPAQPGYPPSGAPGSFPSAAQPGYPPPAMPGSFPPAGQPGYGAYGAPGQPPYPGAYPPPGGVPPKKGGAGRAIILLLVLVVLVGGGAAAWFLFLSPGSPNSPLFDRHGLQSNVPLPGNVAFKLKKTFTSTDSDTHLTISADAWGWTVGGSNAVTVQKFYKDNLGKNGWTKINAFNGDTGQKDVSACQGKQVLIIGASDSKLEATDDNGKVTDTITAPSGGSALITEVSSSETLVALLCSGSGLPNQ